MVTNNSWNSANPAQVAMGGTGIATTTAYAPICGGATATGAFQAASTGLGTSGYVLTSNGAASVPSFQAIPAAPSAYTFMAFLSASVSDVTGDGTYYTIVFGSTLINVGAAYATGTGIYTAPATGNYLFTVGVLSQNNTAAMNTVVQLATTSYTHVGGNNAADFAGNNYYTRTWIVPMTAADTAFIQFCSAGATKVVDIYGDVGTYRTYFAGHKIN